MLLLLLLLLLLLQLRRLQRLLILCRRTPQAHILSHHSLLLFRRKWRDGSTLIQKARPGHRRHAVKLCLDRVEFAEPALHFRGEGAEVLLLLGYADP